MANPLSTTQLAAYRDVFNFRKNFNNAVYQVLKAYGKARDLQPGRGDQQIARTNTAFDFQPLGATGGTAPLYQDLGAGNWRHSYYSEREGELTFQISAPIETAEQMTEAIDRALDNTAAELEAMFMEALDPFKSSGDFLPMYDVLQILPIAPDDRPEELREVNVMRVRFRIKFCIRPSALPTGA